MEAAADPGRVLEWRCAVNAGYSIEIDSIVGQCVVEYHLAVVTL